MDWFDILSKKLENRKEIIKLYHKNENDDPFEFHGVVGVALILSDFVILMKSNDTFEIRDKSNNILLQGSREDVDDYIIIHKLQK